MAAPTVFKTHNQDEHYPHVDDYRLKASLMALADRIDEQSRWEVYDCYNDPFLLREYQRVRDSGMFDKGSKDKSMRLTVSYPSQAVRDFVHAVMKEIYGEDWQKDLRKYHKALRHELLYPWTMVGKI